ncbi:hypothetical protein [Planococcus koreensis]
MSIIWKASRYTNMEIKEPKELPANAGSSFHALFFIGKEYAVCAAAVI